MLKFSPYQKFVVAILAFLQFTIILDFMIISPLGAILMPALNITPAQFGIVVSAYAFSAGISGLLAAGFADKFDRKKLLLFFYTGFLIGTFFCGIAWNYEALLIARMVTGIFGGVIGSIVGAITTDLFPLEMRGRVMGYIQTAFAASQIMGIPAGIFFSNHWGWHAPFQAIVILGLIAGGIIFVKLKPIDEHLKLQKDHSAVEHLWNTVTNKHYTLAFLVTALLSTGGFMLMPFGSAFTVNNLGIAITDLPLIYLITGLAAMFVGPLVGRAADSFGKLLVFNFGATLGIITVVYYTRMTISPLWLVMAVNVVMFVAIFSRMIPSQALISAIPRPANRGSFMAISASVQQISGGLASVIAGAIVVEAADKKLEHFDILGDILVGTTIATMILMYLINKKISQKKKDALVPADAPVHMPEGV